MGRDWRKDRSLEPLKDSLLGPIPTSWGVRPLGELLSSLIDFRGRTPKKLGMKWGGGKIPALSAKNVRMGEIDLARETYYGSLELYSRWMSTGDAREGDVLITMEAPLGNIAQIPDDQRYILSQRVVLLKFDPRVVFDDFMAAQMRHEFFQVNLKQWSTGTTATGIRRAALVCVPAAVPPLPEQYRIAEILDTLDEAIRKTEEVIAKLEQMKQGLLHDLLTRGVDENGELRDPVRFPEQFKESELGLIPRGWEVRRLDQLLAPTNPAMRSGPFGSALLKHELVHTGIPLLGIDNVHINRFEPRCSRFVTKQKAMELSRYLVYPRDVMITIMGTVGRSAVVPDGFGQALSSKHVWTLTFDQTKYSPTLACLQLNYSSWVSKHFSQDEQGAVMSAIRSETLRTLRLPTPTSEEQRRIETFISTILERISKESMCLNHFQTLKKGLMRDLLTGRVRTLRPHPPAPSPETGEGEPETAFGVAP